MSTSKMSLVSQFLNPESLDRARSQIKKTKLDYYDGTLYFTQFTPDLEEQFRQIATADLKDDDILLNGFPRSGNHLVWEILHMILNDTTEFTDRTWTANVFDIWGNDVHKNISALGSRVTRGRRTHKSQTFSVLFEIIDQFQISLTAEGVISKCWNIFVFQ